MLIRNITVLVNQVVIITKNRKLSSFLINCFFCDATLWENHYSDELYSLAPWVQTQPPSFLPCSKFKKKVSFSFFLITHIGTCLNTAIFTSSQASIAIYLPYQHNLHFSSPISQTMFSDPLTWASYNGRNSLKIKELDLSQAYIQNTHLIHQ